MLVLGIKLKFPKTKQTTTEMEKKIRRKLARKRRKTQKIFHLTLVASASCAGKMLMRALSFAKIALLKFVSDAKRPVLDAKLHCASTVSIYLVA